ncbi:MAG: LysR family transcriptional regulator, partial [Chroococcidiopsidaceae cyanobacterium CP_BM_ER_R8_30]|nr:LysR family transcriptional regulator [Chroococcidiopsidaceae cyanobacterium CP_BM_ER_R8_30]
MSAIHHMNMAGVDLNLLIVFDALMEERNVTRAGQQIGLSQPATSAALARLRHLFGDELLVKTSTGMEPTPKALQLAQTLRSALGSCQNLVIWVGVRQKAEGRRQKGEYQALSLFKVATNILCISSTSLSSG